MSYEQRAKKREQAQKLLSDRIPGAMVARLIGTSGATVSDWKNRIEEQGVEAIQGILKPGRKLALTDEQVTTLIKLLKKRPNKYDIVHRHNAWTWDGIVQLVEQELGVKCIRHTVQRSLRRAGWEMP